MRSVHSRVEFRCADSYKIFARNTIFMQINLIDRIISRRDITFRVPHAVTGKGNEKLAEEKRQARRTRYIRMMFYANENLP